MAIAASNVGPTTQATETHSGSSYRLLRQGAGRFPSGPISDPDSFAFIVVSILLQAAPRGLPGAPHGVPNDVAIQSRKQGNGRDEGVAPRPESAWQQVPRALGSR